MYGQSLQEAIDQAGSPVRLLWKAGAEAWVPPVVEPEYAGWAAEQRAWRDGVSIADLSFHMYNTALKGPDAMRLLSDVSANNYERFAIGQAKQFVPVAADGNIISDGILLREGEESFILSGVPCAQNWVAYHAKNGGYDVELSTDPDRSFVKEDPERFRLQVQGPHALELVHRAFGGPLPEVKFFHSTVVELDGMPIRALRHGMAGQPGYEFIGDYRDHDRFLAALMKAGEVLDVVRIGAKSYSTNGVESGWIAAPTAAIYLDPSLAEYRQQLSVFSYEGMNPLHGSLYSEDITDYYTSPWELGYGRSIHLGHDFIGRDALIAAKEGPLRRKVTLECDPAEVRAAFGDEGEYLMSHARHRIETPAGDLVGSTFYSALIEPVGTLLALSLVDESVAAPGSTVDLVWGEHPGADAAPGATDGFVRLRATVRPAPYDEFARTEYRRNLV
ncbi:aminomethyl transferase family protein [Demequina sp. SYSU T00192]|uniref:Aminomethyl transferase family protein n=1 Tax=Demequina litoralis TaxID=3051660 RepID=A0ABT8GAY5_9MICO|nr:aminomethyl transferase family protein [Demequina sp. SYSU T00192]MDN4476305.1 aminomethyl transferase family protein [Demequina sp. SYSU T00192]